MLLDSKKSWILIYLQNRFLLIILDNFDIRSYRFLWYAHDLNNINTPTIVSWTIYVVFESREYVLIIYDKCELWQG